MEGSRLPLEPGQSYGPPTFTAMTPAAKNNLSRVWLAAGLPEQSFDHWSVEFAREIYEIIAMYQTAALFEACGLRNVDPADELLLVLDENGCFDEDETAQQWVPQGWRPESRW